MSDESDDALGWDAIDAALRPIYGGREPYHVGTCIPYALGGPDPIHGISAYKNTDPVPHWHFITYGISELWAKESSDPDVASPAHRDQRPRRQARGHCGIVVRIHGAERSFADGVPNRVWEGGNALGTSWRMICKNRAADWRFGGVKN
jgi:hypothetical protein